MEHLGAIVVVTIWVLLAHHYLTRGFASESATEDYISKYLSLFHEEEVQDYLDEVESCHGRQAIPMEERFWERVGRRPALAKLVNAVYGTTGTRPGDRGRGPEFNPCERTAMAMFRLGHGAGVRATAAMFGVSDGWVVRQTMDFIDRVMGNLKRDFLTWPTRNDQDNISAAFERRTGFRGALFAMDGSHIPVPAPSGQDMSAYYSYKGFYSVILLAMVDNVGLFRWACAGAPGSSGDSGVFRWSKRSKVLSAEQALPEPQRVRICRDRYILGDSAFQNCDWVMTPYDAPSTRRQRVFNFKHSQTRFIVEHAFGRLTLKFMALKHGMFFKIQSVPSVVRACVVLYNFILIHEGKGKDEAYVDDNRTKRGRGSRKSSGVEDAEGPRGRESAYLADAFLLSTWGEEGSALDRARQDAERRYGTNPGEDDGDDQSAVLPG